MSNTGSRAGDDVIQLYVSHDGSDVVQPTFLLKDFQRVRVEAGKSVQVTFHIDPEKLAVVDRKMMKTVESGAVQLLVGESSMKLAGVTLQVKP